MIEITRKLMISVLTAMILGVFCIIGASVRFGPDASVSLLFALWFNRVIMGLLIGAPWKKGPLPSSLLRGAIFGLIVSFAYFASTGFTDIMSFVAGILYGMIIEYVIAKKA